MKIEIEVNKILYTRILKKCFGKYRKTIAFVVGLLAVFCFDDWPCWCILILIYLLIFLQRCIYSLRPRKAFTIGFCFGCGYFASTMHWLTNSFVFVGMEKYAYPALFGLVFYLAIYPGLVCYFTSIFSKTRLAQNLFFSIFWILFEYIRGNLFTGIPWNLLGYAIIDFEYFTQIADIIGVYGLSLLIVLISSFARQKKTFIYSLIIIATSISYGYYKIKYQKTHELEMENKVIIVQPSISQKDKLNSHLQFHNLKKHLALSDFGLEAGKRLVIWPEAAINLVHKSKEIIKYIKAKIKNSNIILLTGADRKEKEKMYNSFLSISSEIQNNIYYDKRHLLPFGEYIPEFMTKIGLSKLTDGAINFSCGLKSRTMKLDGFDQFDVVICYEIAFPGKIMDNLQSKWILNITNDAWFENSAGPHQHLKTVRMRAIEEGRPIVRCANNGISAIIDCYGRIVHKLQLDQQGAIKTTVPQKYIKTIYSKYQNKFMFIMLVFLFALALLMSKKKKRKNMLINEKQ